MPAADQPQLSVIIPAFNEEARLPVCLSQVVEYLGQTAIDYEIIIVDDGSSDNTAQLVAILQSDNPRLSLIRLPVNRGKGNAVKCGMLAARGRLRLFADADGATPIGELEQLSKSIGSGADVAVASRALKDEKSVVKGTLHRKLMGTFFNLLVRSLAVKGVHDTQCGFKLFTAAAAQAVFPLQTIDGFGFDVEILFIAQLRGLRIAEVPVSWTDIKGTKVSIVRDSLRMLTDIFRVRRNKLLGAYRVKPGANTR